MTRLVLRGRNRNPMHQHRIRIFIGEALRPLGRREADWYAMGVDRALWGGLLVQWEDGGIQLVLGLLVRFLNGVVC